MTSINQTIGINDNMIQHYLSCNPEVTSSANIFGTIVGDELNIFPGIEQQSLLILKVHQNSIH
jgi:hypothetical protein